jgi:hypothetical protein
MGETRERGKSRWFVVLTWLAVVYMLPFASVAIDEYLLETYWFSDHMPSGFNEAMRTIYPFYKLLNREDRSN